MRTSSSTCGSASASRWAVPAATKPPSTSSTCATRNDALELETIGTRRPPSRICYCVRRYPVLWRRSSMLRSHLQSSPQAGRGTPSPSFEGQGGQGRVRIEQEALEQVARDGQAVVRRRADVVDRRARRRSTRARASRMLFGGALAVHVGLDGPQPPHGRRHAAERETHLVDRAVASRQSRPRTTVFEIACAARVPTLRNRCRRPQRLRGRSPR